MQLGETADILEDKVKMKMILRNFKTWSNWILGNFHLEK